MKNVKQVITQNIENLHVFSKIYEKNLFTIVDLPDFKNSQDLICTDNNKIVIGIIGLISEIKGKYLLHFFLDFFKKSKHVEVVIMGSGQIYFEKSK